MSFLNSRKTIVSFSILIAIVLVVGAFFLSGRHLPVNSADAASTEELLKTYAAKDTDSDGLPDWEESLYGTNPNNAHSVKPDLTDGEAVAKGLATPRYSGQTHQDGASTTSADLASTLPGTDPAAGSLTEQFSKLFFNNYLASRGDTPPSADQMQAFVQDAVTQLEQTRVRTDAFTADAVRVSGTGPDAMRIYAAQAETAFAQNAANLPYDELTYLSDAVSKNDATALKNIDAISKSYANTAQALAKITVPKEAAVAHLAFINAMARMGVTVSDLAAVNSDPIRTLVSIGGYKEDAAGLAAGLEAVYGVFEADGVVLIQGTPGYYFYDVAANASVASSTTP